MRQQTITTGQPLRLTRWLSAFTLLVTLSGTDGLDREAGATQAQVTTGDDAFEVASVRRVGPAGRGRGFARQTGNACLTLPKRRRTSLARADSRG